MSKILLSLTLFFTLALPVAAQDTGVPAAADVPAVAGEATSAVKPSAADLRERRAEILDKKQELLKDLRARREEFVKQNQEKREIFRRAVAERLETIKDQREAARRALKLRLEKIKDLRRRERVEKIDNQFDVLNRRVTDQMTKALEQIEKVLANVSSRADKAEASGLNVTAVRAAIKAATDEIVVARALVQAQTGKVYNIEIKDEATLKDVIQAVRQAVFNDLDKVKTAVKKAREAVRQAAVALAQIPKVDEAKEE